MSVLEAPWNRSSLTNSTTSHQLAHHYSHSDNVDKAAEYLGARASKQ